MELLYFFLSSFFFLFLLHVSDVHRKRRLPPGPLRLPIIGNIHQLLGPKPHKTLATLAKKHGPLMTIQLGSITTVVASTPDAARDSNLPRFDDVLDSMLDYSEENEDEFSLKHIKMLLMEVLVAGTDTIASSTTWIMSELLLNPHMLLKVREEVSHIVGEDGTIEEAKTLELPYLHAVIKETLRLHAGSPLLAPHITQTEVQIGNYVVPKNTRLVVNAWAVARDERYWENPRVFMPERFLKNKVDFKGQHFEFIPFGSGRRKCPGMPLAERMLSLIVASFVYHFDWDANEEVNMDDKFGLALLKATPLVVTPQVVTK
ncbi:putative geraniol 8-hydroxylase [Helianthus annuus]|nr:putative geraniol 8-hydroxylase [Helianthus annuus]